jgi:hypothetical protein
VPADSSVMSCAKNAARSALLLICVST